MWPSLVLPVRRLRTIGCLLCAALTACAARRGATVPPPSADGLVSVAGAGAESAGGYNRFDVTPQSSPGWRYAHFLAEFTEEEDAKRLEFFDLQTDADRDVFVRRHGLVRRWELGNALQVGMPQGEVRRLLGDPNYAITHLEPAAPRWLYWEPTGYQMLYLYLQFRNYALADWGTFIPAPESSHKTYHGLWEAEYDRRVEQPLLVFVNESDHNVRLRLIPYGILGEAPPSVMEPRRTAEQNVTIKPGTTWERALPPGQVYYRLEARDFKAQAGDLDLAPAHRYRLLYRRRH